MDSASQKVEINQSNKREATQYSFTVEAIPNDSTIKIMNIVPKYHNGIELQPGEYDILVKREGYERYREMINIVDSDVQMGVSLAKIAQEEKSVEKTNPKEKPTPVSKKQKPTEAQVAKENERRKQEWIASTQKKKNNTIAKKNTSSAPVGKDGNPDYHGGYVETTGGRFVEMDAKRAYRTKIVRGDIGITTLLSMPNTYYIVDQNGAASLQSNDLEGVVIKGDRGQSLDSWVVSVPR